MTQHVHGLFALTFCATFEAIVMFAKQAVGLEGESMP